MKNVRYFKLTMLQASLFTATLFGIASVSYGQKTNDTKANAKEQNETKFGNTNKEKDAKFLVDVAEINLEEIELGQLAQQKSSMADVKELGKMMETSHQKCMNELKKLAKGKSITIPTSITDNGKDAYKKLSDLSGASFDKKYCDMMAKGHKGAITEFEKASKESGDADIKQFAASTLPELRKHLEHATTCQAKCEKMK